MTHVEKLNKSIDDARQASRDATTQAAVEAENYDQAIGRSDLQGADAAMVAKAAAERMAQIHKDHSRALGKQRHVAERADFEPVYQDALAPAADALKAEIAVHAELRDLIALLKTYPEKLRTLHWQTSRLRSVAFNAATMGRIQNTTLGHRPNMDTAANLSGLKGALRDLEISGRQQTDGALGIVEAFNSTFVHPFDKD